MEEQRPTCKCHGEPMRKNGKPNGKQEWRCFVKAKAYQQTPEYKARDKARCQTPEYKAYDKARRQYPQYRMRKNHWQRMNRLRRRINEAQI